MTEEIIDAAPAQPTKANRTWLAGLVGVTAVILLLALLLLRTL
jgi:hypothetical protein